MNIRTQTLGIIESFDPVTQFATVRLICNGTVSTSQQNYYNVGASKLIEVMVEFPRCGQFCITFPIKGGEICIVEFMEQGISHWQYENKLEYTVVDGRPEAASMRRYDVSDAICRVSIGNLETAIPNFHVDNFEVRNMQGNQRMTFYPDGNILLTTTEGIKLHADKDIELEAGGNIIATAGGDISNTATGAINDSAGSNISLKATGAFAASGATATVTGTSSAALGAGGATMTAAGGAIAIKKG